jgi:hypothetical protein
MIEILEFNSDLSPAIAIASILLLLIARILHGRRRKKTLSDLPIRTFKKCPQCAAEVPSPVLVCDGCDYNFLASPILRHQLLAAPSLDNELRHQAVA